MSDVPMPRDLTEEAVAEWLYDLTRDPFSHVPSSTLPAWHWKVSPHPERARAVLALVEAKVRDGVALARVQERVGGWTDDDAIVTVVMNKEATHG